MIKMFSFVFSYGFSNLIKGMDFLRWESLKFSLVRESISLNIISLMNSAFNSPCFYVKMAMISLDRTNNLVSLISLLEIRFVLRELLNLNSCNFFILLMS